MELVTLIYLVQHGNKERTAGDPGLTALGTRQAAVTAHGSCAIATLDDLDVAAIASTAHLT
jgi:hypothetical protein